MFVTYRFRFDLLVRVLVDKGADYISSGFLSRSSNKRQIDPPLLHIGSQVTTHHLSLSLFVRCVLTLFLVVPP
jgi:hypothetical protein